MDLAQPLSNQGSMRAALFSLICGLSFLTVASAPAETLPDDDVYRSHGMALHGAIKYKRGFTHFDYVNPDAPKGGILRLSGLGTFDNLNPYIIKGTSDTWSGLIMHAHLMTRSEDEAFTAYGWIAKEIAVPKDRSWVEFTLDPRARFSDGSPVRVEDVIFSVTILRTKGLPFFRQYFGDIVKMEKTGPNKVRFIFRRGGNRELPLIIAQDLPILSKAYWEKRNFEAVTLDPPVVSGPYRIVKRPIVGRTIIYSRIKDYWAKDLPALKGYYNFDHIRIDYYKDSNVAREALKAGEFDYRRENSANAWAKAYNIRAVRDGRLIKRAIPHQRPAGMQGFVMNMRRTPFKDWRVRRALGLVFDFQWSNKTLFFSQYQRTSSFFENSELAARPGPPTGEVLKILEKFRGKIPDRVFDTPYRLPVFTGNGFVRSGMREAFKLLDEAGWEVRNFKLVNKKTGKPFVFEIMLVSPAFVRIVLPYKKNLAKLGITMRVRLVDTSQFIRRVQKFDFDMIVAVFGQSSSPGNEQRIFWSSKAAKLGGSRNYMGLQNEAVDALIELLIKSKDRQTLIFHTRALDRILLSYHFVVPNWYSGVDRMIYWNKFGLPKGTKRRGIPLMSWWQDPTKAARLRGRIKSLPVRRGTQ